jgi:O-antigen/teichoic acid export membrane protein
MSVDDLGQPRTDITRRVAQSAGFLMLARLIIRASGLIGTAVLARILLPEDYGVLALGLAVVGLAQTLTGLPIGTVIIRLEQVFDTHLKTAFTLQVIRGAIVAVTLFALAAPLAALMKQPSLVDVLRWMALIPLIDGFMNGRFILYQRALDFSKEFRLSVVTSLLGLLATIALALWLQNYWALVIGTILGRLFNTIGSFLIAAPLFGFTLRHWREFLFSAGWLTGAGIIGYVNYRSDTFIVSGALGPEALGHYSMGDSIAASVTHELTQPLSRAVYPGLAAVADDAARLRSAYYKAQATVLGFVLPLGVGAALVARDLVLLMLGEKWLDAVPIIQFVAPVAAIGALSSAATSLAYLRRRENRVFTRELVSLLIRLPMMIAGVLAYGMIGLLVARSLAGLINLVLLLRLGAHAIADHWFRAVLAGWRSLVAGAAMVLAVVALQRFALTAADNEIGAIVNLAWSATLGAALYVGTHAALWWASGKPDGFESFALALAQKTLGRLKLR